MGVCGGGLVKCGVSCGIVCEEGRRFALSREWPTEAHPTSKLAGTPISDDETVAKMGHPICYGLDLGHPTYHAANRRPE
jgi:hypothetical protein